MRLRTYILVGVALLVSALCSAQIATPGSRPVGIGGEETTRSVLHLPVSRLGTFDRDSALHAMEAADKEALRVYLFAHKEETDIDLLSLGQHTGLRDGRQVWQYRISSPGALSLSFFFDRVSLPEGALLFVYTGDGSKILGGFGSENVSPSGTLATQPIESDDVVVELQAPAGTQPILHLSEVNHGIRPLSTRAVFGSNFGRGSSSLSCTPEVVCMPGLDEMKRAVVVVVINGVGIGSGTMVSNTQGDNTPYLLTAAHVLSVNFKHMDIEHQAEQTVAIFNYESPSCSGEVMPDMSQSVSGAVVVGFDKPTDACLIRLNNIPPESYRPYYLGWTAESHPQGSYINIHHPLAMTKRVNYYNKDVKVNVTCETDMHYFGDHMHYEVTAWDVGTTAGGSSGSPLIDREKRVMGGLSAGSSFCSTKAADYFFSLANVWAQSREATQSIVRALSPRGGSVLTSDGRDPYGSPRSRAKRITHVSSALTGDSLSGRGTQLSAVEILGSADAVGEHYLLKPHTLLYGAYVMLDMSQVKPNELSGKETMTLEVYTGGDTPALTLPVDLSKIIHGTLNSELDRIKYREVFIPFDQPLELSDMGELILAIPTQSLPKGVSILHQQYRGAGGQMMTRSGNKWSPRTLKSGTIALWMDPLIGDPDSDRTEKSQPLFTLTPISREQILVQLADRAEGGADLSIYTLQGQKVYTKTITSRSTILDRQMLEGMGVLVIHVDAGSEQLTVKTLFPAI